MTSQKLEEKCISLFGREIGRNLYRLMAEIAGKDFCVATAWNEKEISIARSCEYRGRIFLTDSQYQKIIMHDGKETHIRDLSYKDIAQHLPNAPSDRKQKHCSLDNQ